MEEAKTKTVENFFAELIAQIVMDVCEEMNAWKKRHPVLFALIIARYYVGHALSLKWMRKKA